MMHRCDALFSLSKIEFSEDIEGISEWPQPNNQNLTDRKQPHGSLFGKPAGVEKTAQGDETMSHLRQALTPEQKLDIIFPLINKIPVHDDATLKLVSDINSIILGDLS